MSTTSSPDARSQDFKNSMLKAANGFGQPDRRSDYLALYDDNASIYDTPAGTLKGIQAIRQYYESLWASFPDMKLELNNLVAESDKVACTFLVTGTHSGTAFNGILASGKRIRLSGVTMLRFSNNGKCIERWHGADSLPLLQQLGAMATKAIITTHG